MLNSGMQIKAARALLGWSQQALATAAGLHVNSVTHWEAKAFIKRHRFDRNSGAARIERALSDAGVGFITDHGPGVHLVAGVRRTVRARPGAHHGLQLPLQQGGQLQQS